MIPLTVPYFACDFFPQKHTRQVQGRIQTKTHGGLQVDYPVIGGLGARPPNIFKKCVIFRDIRGGGGVHTPETPLDTALRWQNLTFIMQGRPNVRDCHPRFLKKLIPS